MSASAPRTIKALAAFEPGLSLRPFEYVSRALGLHDVEIAITHCGICVTDVHFAQNGWGFTQYPIVPGHEIVGSISAVGSSVVGLAVGDRVGVGAQVFSCQDKTNCRECATDNDPICERVVHTYGSSYADGATAYGGYAEAIRVNANYVFKIPEKIPSDVAAPLLCAGVTVFTPLKEYVRPGQRVGIVGIGGLGHLGLQFAKALGAIPVAFSHSPAKEQQSRELGAVDFVNISDQGHVSKAAQSVDVLLVTADAKDQPYNLYVSCIKKGGRLVMVGAPSDEIKISAVMLLTTKISIVGSAIGGIKRMNEMLALAAEKEVRPIIQKLPMTEVNKGLELANEGKVRFRVVLEN